MRTRIVTVSICWVFLWTEATNAFQTLEDRRRAARQPSTLQELSATTPSSDAQGGRPPLTKSSREQSGDLITSYSSSTSHSTTESSPRSCRNDLDRARFVAWFGSAFLGTATSSVGLSCHEGAWAADAGDNSSAPNPRPASNEKVLVLGGTGFVGSQVVATLRALQVPVEFTSTNGRDGSIAVDLSSDTDQQRLVKLVQDEQITAVISCVGKIGTTPEQDEIVNAATGRTAINIASSPGGTKVRQFVYVTVAPEVQEFAKDIKFMSGYLKGKAYSREAVLSQFGPDNAVLIEPTFIYGGGSFELNPPRVPNFYGSFIEGVLSASPIRQLERIMSPGIIKIALEPPVPVEAVAKAAVAGALGKSPMNILDTHDKIKAAGAVIDLVES